jgi:hypothetical protein
VAGVAEIQLTALRLDEITRREVSRYVATSEEYRFYPVLDDEHQTYAVLIVPQASDERPAWAFVMARVVGEYVVIEEDGPADKPLVEALIHNGGVPREKIVLAYAGETLPETTALPPSA